MMKIAFEDEDSERLIYTRHSGGCRKLPPGRKSRETSDSVYAMLQSVGLYAGLPVCCLLHYEKLGRVDTSSVKEKSGRGGRPLPREVDDRIEMTIRA